MESPVFIARGLTKTYGSGEARVFALRDISLEIRQGEFLVLLGPSGSGKSTLLNILGGLDAPTAGTARWRDHELTGASDEQLTAYRREHVGFVFQFYNLIPNLTVRENVRLVAQIAADPMRPEEALELVGLSHRLDHFPRSCRAASSSAWPLRAPSSSAPTSCSATSRQVRSTPTPGAWFSRRSPRLMRSSGRPRSSSRTTRPSPPWPPASCG